MREITLVEKVETSAIIPNAVHITTKSKVSLCSIPCMELSSFLGGGGGVGVGRGWGGVYTET